MTNLQEGASRLSGPLLRRVWLGLPIALGAALAALLAAVAVLPLWLSLQQDTKRLEELQSLRDQVTLMRGQIRSLSEAEEKALRQKGKLFELVTGNGDLSTFLATLDQEARSAGVQLELFEPQSDVAPAGTARQPGRGAAAPAPAPGAAAPPPPDSLEVEGLQRNAILLSAKGSYPRLLAFLRRLEQLNVLVVQSDLNLLLEEVKRADPTKPAPIPAVVMKVVLSLYDKGGAPVAPPAGAASSPPGAVPPHTAAPASPQGAPPAPPPAQGRQNGAPNPPATQAPPPPAATSAQPAPPSAPGQARTAPAGAGAAPAR